jgi:Raf kinase inhibitor-like YbhB/YbcL family protein
MRLTSSAFEDGQQLPLRYTKDGDNTSPPLAWADLPKGTSELALFFENVTPRTKEPFPQWLVYGIAAELDGLVEGFKHKRKPSKPGALRQGRNAVGNVGYDGPLGSVGRRVRFRFRLCALDEPLDLPPGADKAALTKAISGHVLAEADLNVVHERQE